MAFYKYKATGFTHDRIGIDPEGCGCTDCIVGDSFPLDAGLPDSIAHDIMLGRELINRTSAPIVITVTRHYDDWYEVAVVSAALVSQVVVRTEILPVT